jgi:hypothetical protein
MAVKPRLAGDHYFHEARRGSLAVGSHHQAVVLPLLQAADDNGIGDRHLGRVDQA